jgi:GT2 family glycosyltransferase/predicted SAM-dependent methyltransferase
MTELQDSVCTIIIPTYDNPSYIGPCVNSILNHSASRELMRIIIVNNGSKEIENYVTKHPLVTMIHAEKNLGWEGGLKLGLENTKSPIVCFMNDDTYVPFSSALWLSRCLSEFRNDNVAAVGPSSNVVRGAQNIFLDQFGGFHAPYAPFLIGFCMFVRRRDLDAAGGIDETLPGGDDFDLSIRLKKLGKKLLLARDVFILHHGFKTGERLRGTSDRPGGWNSREMSENTNMALIRKHGFRSWMDCNFGTCEKPEDTIQPSRENEIEIVKAMVKPGVVYDLGCGHSKTIPEAIGIDRIPQGNVILNLEGATSVADIECDVQDALPIADESADTIIARHIFEHCLDNIKTAREWIKKLKLDGRLIIAVPDERIGRTIPLNPEHVHAYSPESLNNLMEAVGMKQVEMKDNFNGVSFVAAFEKNGAYH